MPLGVLKDYAVGGLGSVERILRLQPVASPARCPGSWNRGRSGRRGSAATSAGCWPGSRRRPRPDRRGAGRPGSRAAGSGASPASGRPGARRSRRPWPAARSGSLSATPAQTAWMSAPSPNAPDALQLDLERPAARRAASSASRSRATSSRISPKNRSVTCRASSGRQRAPSTPVWRRCRRLADLVGDGEGGEQADHGLTSLTVADGRDRQVVTNLDQQGLASATPRPDISACVQSGRLNQGLCSHERLQPRLRALDPRGSRRHVGGRRPAQLHARRLQQGGAGPAALGRPGLPDRPTSRRSATCCSRVTPDGRLAGFTAARHDRRLRAAGACCWSACSPCATPARARPGILYWTIVALIGAVLGVLVLVYTGASIASTFLITAAAFGGLQPVRLHHQEGPDRHRQLPDHGPDRPDHRLAGQHVPAQLGDAASSSASSAC